MKDVRIITFIRKYKLEFFLIVFQLAFLCFNNASFTVKDSVILCYINDFSTGFGPRKLVASLTSLLFGNFVSYNEIRIMALIVSVALMVLFAILMGSAMRRVEKGMSHSFFYLIVLYLSCSFAVTFLYQWKTFGRMEAWHILILILYLLISHKANSNSKPILMLIACVISMFVHHMFLSTFLPAYLFLAIYELRKEDFDKGLFIRYVSVFVCVAASFLILHLIKWNELSYNETLTYLNNKTNAEVSDYFLQWIYYEPITNHYDQFVKPFLSYNVSCVVLSLFLFFPLYYVLFKGVRKSIVLAKKSYNNKSLVLYIFACLPMLIAYVTASDFGRWTASHFNCFFLFFIYLIIDNNQTANELLISFGNHIKKHKFFYMVLPLYLLLFSKNMCKFPGEFESIFKIIINAIKLI